MTGRPLRIAHVTSHYAPDVGGVAQVVMRLATGMAAHGHQVEILTQTHDRRLCRCEWHDGVTVRRFIAGPAQRDLTFAPSLLAHLLAQRARYDIVHAHNYHALPALAAALSHPRLLVFSPYYHGTGHAPLRRLLHLPYRLCGRYLFRRAAAVSCLSQAEAALVRRHFGLGLPCLRVIRPGPTVPRVGSVEPMAEPGTVVLSVGRLERYKQTHVLVEAMTSLDARFVLHIAGDGPERPRLEALAAARGLAQRVFFHGYLDDQALARWLRGAAVYVNLSRQESFGLVVLEALAAGIPVIATAIPPFREHARGIGRDRMALVSVAAPASSVARIIKETVERASVPVLLPPASLPSWDTALDDTLRLYRELMA